VRELYAFMATAKATLDESLEEGDEGALSAVASTRSASLPPSAKATPRGLLTAEASRACCCAHAELSRWQHCCRFCNSCDAPSPKLSGRRTWPRNRPPALPLLQSSTAMARPERLRTPAADPQQAQLDAEEARRSRLYSIMACIREVQKRNDRTGGPLLALLPLRV
jgi:hypothetical protein